MRLCADQSLAELAIVAHTDEIRRASAWLEKSALERGVPADQIARLDLCLNEALANVIAHGGASALAVPIALHLEVRREQDGGGAMVTVCDAGIAFDPLALPLQPRPKLLAEAEPGGLGLLMLRSFADNVGYCHDGQNNRLSFSVHWSDG